MTFIAQRRSVAGPSAFEQGPSCNACGRQKVGLRICPCEKAYYCDAKCQQRDWPTHAPVCRHGRPREAPSTACAGCGRVGTDHAWCQCATVLYCSRACQLKHWADGHKQVCAPFYKHQQQKSKPRDGKMSMSEAAPQNRFLALLDQLKRESEAT
uniref:MYND-type domain-containing protein n=1 Tax=Neobodo designis TaxID=312471 RepID=A0A7S1QGV1_NEODS|mmetsp:Transcript_46132/g.142140  ORF Transcript_46132/g.142140 Transcript_46132/m.142140 type:complete len:154 (+) Transcript_46132:44-505(+)